MQTKKKRTPLVAIFTLALLLGVPYAAASETLQADIPFDFQVKGRELPKGLYEVRLDPSGLVRLRGAEVDGTALVFSVALGANVELSEGHLIFLSTGDTHVLTEVWQPGRGNGRELLPSFKVRAYENYERTAVNLGRGADKRSG